MSIDYKFKEDLEKFERETCNIFFYGKKIRIGLSIQLIDDVQDEDSETRIPTHSGINAYCKSIQKSNLQDCNYFDIHTKKFVHLLKNDKEGILCMCKADVTNILIPFKFKNAKKPIFYIFYGHFLLKNNPGNYSLKEDKLSKLDLKKAVNKFTVLNKYAKEFIPIDTDSKYSKYQNHKDRKKDISRLDYETLREFRLFVEARFNIFLNEHFTLDRKRRLIPNPDLYDFMNRSDSERVIILLEALKDTLKSWVIEDKNKIEESIELIDELILLLIEKGNLLDKKGVNLLKSIKEWSNGDNTGEATNKNWIKLGNTLKEKCNGLSS